MEKSMGMTHDHIGSMTIDELKILSTYGRELERFQSQIFFTGDFNVS
jgi:hypothetical protein